MRTPVTSRTSINEIVVTYMYIYIRFSYSCTTTCIHIMYRLSVRRSATDLEAISHAPYLINKMANSYYICINLIFKLIYWIILILFIYFLSIFFIYLFHFYLHPYPYFILIKKKQQKNHIVMVSVLASNAVDPEFRALIRSNQRL